MCCDWAPCDTVPRWLSAQYWRFQPLIAEHMYDKFVDCFHVFVTSYVLKCFKTGHTILNICAMYTVFSSFLDYINCQIVLLWFIFIVSILNLILEDCALSCHTGFNISWFWPFFMALYCCHLPVTKFVNCFYVFVTSYVLRSVKLCAKDHTSFNNSPFICTM